MKPHQRERILAGIGEMERRHGEGRDRKSISMRELIEFRDAANAERVWAVGQPNYHSTRGLLGLYAVFMDDLAIALDELVNFLHSTEPGVPSQAGPAGPQERVAAVVIEGLPRLRALAATG